MTARTRWRWILAAALLPAAAATSYGCAIVGGIQPPAPATCSDRKHTGANCGGLCGACDGAGCAMDADCMSGLCGNSGRCVPPTNASACPPGVGPDRCQACHACAPGLPCVVDLDCATGLCVGHRCTKCNPSGDNCADKMCSSNQTCLTITCANGVKDGDEEGVDCGGSCPTPCGATSCDDGGCPDAGDDGGSDGGDDAGTDGGDDAGTDAGNDAGLDAGGVGADAG